MRMPRHLDINRMQNHRRRHRQLLLHNHHEHTSITRGTLYPAQVRDKIDTLLSSNSS